MRMRGMSSDPAKQERIDQVLRSIPGGKKKWVRYDEGAILYSMGIHTCIPLSVRAAEISAEGSSIYQYDPRGKAANAYRTLTEEVMDKTHNKCYNLST